MSSDELKEYRGQVYAWKERDTAVMERLEACNANLVAALRITRANNDALKDRDAKLVAALEAMTKDRDHWKKIAETALEEFSLLSR